MALRLIVGAANTGKTELVYQELAVAASREQPALLLPSEPDVRRAHEHFAEARVPGVQCATLDDWLEEMWTLHGDGRRFVGPAARAALLGEIVVPANLEQLAISGSTAGFILLLADIAKRADAIRRPQEGGLLCELADLLALYQEHLRSAGMIEPAQAALALAEDTPRVPGMVAVNGFGDLTASQERLLVALSRANDVTIVFSWEEGRVAFEALTPLVDRLLKGGAELQVAPGGGAWSPGLTQLQARLFEGRTPVEVPRALSMGVAAGSEAECALVARFARRALDRGVAPDGVAVSFRDVGRRRTVLAAALAAEGVPAVFDISLAFSKTPFGSAVSSLLDACARRGDARERILAFLQSPYSGVDVPAVAAADVDWRRKRLDADAILASAKSLRGAGAIVRQACDLTARQVDGSTAGEWQKMAAMLLRNAVARHDLRGAEGALDTAAHRGLLRSISEVASVDGGVTEGELSRALRSVRVSTAQDLSAGGVLVTEAHRLRGRRFDTLILGGLTAGEFSPEERESLATGLLVKLGMPSESDPVLRERMLFHTIVTRADCELILVRQASNERGEAVRPSAFWDDVLDVYRSPEDAAEDIWPTGLVPERLSISELTDAAPAFTQGRRAARAGAVNAAPVPPSRGLLRSRRALDELAVRDEFSVSEVETYISCPYRWFYERALRPAEVDTAFDARERGSLAHDILATFYGMWRDSGRARIAAAELDEALRMLSEAVAVSRSRPARAHEITLADEISAAKAVRWAKDILLDDVDFLPGFVPAHHELRFGRRYGRPIEFGGVSLVGSVDRVDVSESGLIVIDYKSSSGIEGRKGFASHGLLQLPVYASVASTLLDLPALGGLYRSMTKLSVRGFWNDDAVDLRGKAVAGDAADADGVQEEIRSAATRLSSAVDGMRGGLIEPRPLSPGACKFCDARDVCGEAL